MSTFAALLLNALLNHGRSPPAAGPGRRATEAAAAETVETRQMDEAEAGRG